MTDAALVWKEFSADIALTAEGDLLLDQGLYTAVMISLFSDARAPDEAILPTLDSDRRGWWPDSDTASLGSLLWLLAREKTLPETAARAREYCETALAWLVGEEIAEAVTVEALLVRPFGLQLTIIVKRGTARRYTHLWEGVAESDPVVISGSTLKLQFV